MKLCKDCDHVIYPNGVALCGRTKLINSVTGEPFYQTCHTERTDSHRIRFFQSNCGSRGRHWEPKDAATPHKDTVITPTQFRWETPADGELEGLPGTRDYTYDEFSKDCDRRD